MFGRIVRTCFEAVVRNYYEGVTGGSVKVM